MHKRATYWTIPLGPSDSCHRPRRSGRETPALLIWLEDPVQYVDGDVDVLVQHQIAELALERLVSRGDVAWLCFNSREEW